MRVVGGERGRPPTSGYAGQFTGQLQCHRSGANGSWCTRQSQILAQTGHPGRCLLSLHAEHFWCHPLYPYDVDHWNGRRRPGISSCHDVLHLRKWRKKILLFKNTTLHKSVWMISLCMKELMKSMQLMGFCYVQHVFLDVVQWKESKSLVERNITKEVSIDFRFVFLFSLSLK